MRHKGRKSILSEETLGLMKQRRENPPGTSSGKRVLNRESVIAVGVELVNYGDISEYMPLIRHDEIDLIFSHSIGALPSPFCFEATS
jgi:hypothetical protein